MNARRMPALDQKETLAARHSGNGTGGARQYHSDFRKFARLGIDLDRAAMLLHDDVVTDREPKPCALSGGFRREEWIEHLLPDVGRNAGAVVADPDFNAVAKVLGRG